MRNIFHDFLSHRALFYGLFSQGAKNIVDMSELLAAVVDMPSIEEREPFYKQINAFEETGDDITHKIYLGLDKVFFTPINRKDIHLLASAIDDVSDNIHEAAGRMDLYLIEQFLPAVSEMAKYIYQSCIEIQKLIDTLSKIEDPEIMLAICRIVKQNEHHTDVIYSQALGELFANEKDAITLIKHRDILFSLEASANKCKSATDVIEIIILNSI